MKRAKYFFIVAAVALLIIFAGFIEQYYRLEVCNFVSRDGESHGYFVFPEMSADSLYTLMCVDYEVQDEDAWHAHSRHLLYQSPKSGYYRFPVEMGNKYLIRRLQLGQETPINISFTHAIRTPQQLAGAMGQKLLLDSAEVIQRLTDKTYLAQYGLTPETAVCLFIPNTYEVYWTMTPEQFVNRMIKESKRFWNDSRMAKAKALGLSPSEVMTLASIVDEETAKDDEKPLVAGLYLNRLKRGMLLQADPTVKFALGDFELRRILYVHLQTNSPYNTYKYAGLPPGPIRIPSISAIESVLSPAKHSYIYMCAKEDFSGYHNFATTLTQHNANARRYQQALNKLGIKK
jgi:UPF0755 protein